MVFRKRNVLVALICAISLLSVACWSFFSSKQPSGMTLTMLDVGQGDALYIRFADGSDMLVDSGPDSRVLSELAAVMPWWDHHIDTIVLTHPDSDHIAGFAHVLEQYSVGRAFDCGFSERATHIAQDVYAQLSRRAITLVSVHAQDIFTVDSGEIITIFSPAEDQQRFVDDTNACSIVMSIDDRNARALLTGDAPIEIEQDIVSAHPGSLDVDLLKVGHHGSKTSTSEEWLAATMPEVALISSGVRNRYHHPHPSVVNRLQDYGILTFNTATEGRIICTSDGEAFFCEP